MKGGPLAPPGLPPAGIHAVETATLADPGEPMRVLIPSALHSYTGGPWSSAGVTQSAAVLDDLNGVPGIRFRMIDEHARIRRHIRFFIAGEAIHDLAAVAAADGELCIDAGAERRLAGSGRIDSTSPGCAGSGRAQPIGDLPTAVFGSGYGRRRNARTLLLAGGLGTDGACAGYGENSRVAADRRRCAELVVGRFTASVSPRTQNRSSSAAFPLTGNRRAQFSLEARVPRRPVAHHAARRIFQPARRAPGNSRTVPSSAGISTCHLRNMRPRLWPT